MNGTPVFINIQQLMMDRGRLQLAQPSESAKPARRDTQEISKAVGILLEEIHSSEAIITIATMTHVRIRLTSGSIQWAEKSPDQLNRYELKFDDGRLLFNGNVTDPSFAASFADKIDKLISSITSQTFSIHTKEI
ncbi:hypothetical protein EB093_05150 [bacterium]|nr:hypothetical protein [bacterium]